MVRLLLNLARTLNMPPGAPIAMENFDMTLREAFKTIFGNFVHECVFSLLVADTGTGLL